jgi:hypothetical protein
MVCSARKDILKQLQELQAEVVLHCGGDHQYKRHIIIGQQGATRRSETGCGCDARTAFSSGDTWLGGLKRSLVARVFPKHLHSRHSTAVARHQLLLCIHMLIVCTVPKLKFGRCVYFVPRKSKFVGRRAFIIATPTPPWGSRPPSGPFWSLRHQELFSNF